MGKEYVFDSSTLILLAKATILRSFANINRILITPKVEAESLEKERDDSKIIRKLMDEGIIKETEQVSDGNFGMDFSLERGEAETLNYAYKNKKIMATDDLRAIRACKALNVKFITAIHCLLALYSNNILDRQLALEKLDNLEKHGRYSAQIAKDARNRIEGDKNG